MMTNNVVILQIKQCVSLTMKVCSGQTKPIFPWMEIFFSSWQCLVKCTHICINRETTSQQKVLVWCGFCSRFAVDPFFFNDTLTGVEYLSMLKEYVEPFLRRKGCIATITFQQDGAPPHINNEVKQYLQQRFSGGRVLSRHFEFNWPPRSPDITPMDYLFWGVY